jgi:hypothetical protein
MTQSNFAKLASHKKYRKFLIFELVNLAFQSCMIAAAIRQDNYENSLNINGAEDILNSPSNIFRKSLLDAFRSSFGGGGENTYDIPIQIFLSAFETIFIPKRNTDYFTELEAKEKNLEKVTENSLYRNGRDLQKDGKDLYYTESVSIFNLKRLGRVVGGIALVIGAFYINSLLKKLHKVLSESSKIPKIALVLLQGVTGTLFSLTFVFGMLIFAIAMSSVIANISQKLEKNPDGTNKENGERNKNIVFAIGFIGFSIVLPSAFLLLSKKFGDLAENSLKLSIFYNFLATALLVLSILFGISILGRRFLESLFKKDVIKACPQYNSLLGKGGADDKFTNDAINDNCKATYGYDDNRNVIYIAIPNGYKLENYKEKKLVKIGNGVKGDKKIHAYDADDNFYTTIKSEKDEKNHRNRAIARLIFYAVGLYAALFFCYGIVFCCGEFGEKVFAGIAKNLNLPEWVGVVANNIVNDIAYFFAIVIGMMAIGCLLKVVNIISFDKNFEEKIKSKNENEVKSIHSRNEYKMWGIGAGLLGSTGGMIGLVVLLAEKKIEFTLAIPVLILAFLTIGRICMAFMTQAIGQNIQIEEIRGDLFPQSVQVAT